MELGPAQFEDFHIEGISPSKMVSIKSVLETLNVKIVKYNESGAQMAKINGTLCKMFIPEGRTKSLLLSLNFFIFMGSLVFSRFFQ